MALLETRVLDAKETRAMLRWIDEQGLAVYSPISNKRVDPIATMVTARYRANQSWRFLVHATNDAAIFRMMWC